MKFPTIPSLICATLVVGAAADFQIYYEKVAGTNPLDDQPSTWQNIRVFKGDPDCTEVDTNAALLSVEDASDSGNARCDGCDNGEESDTWDIKELELHAGGDWGHYTIYKSAGYKLTPEDDGPLKGKCTRDSDNEYDCTIGLANMHGTRLFKCESPKEGI